MPNQLLASRLKWTGVEVLEIGAGTGVSHKFFSALGARVTSVEPNRWMRHAALQAGVKSSNYYELAAEDLTADWLEAHVDATRLLVQGVVGFMKDGLGTLEPILKHQCVTEVVLVDWVGATAQGPAPVRHSYRAADYVAAAEAAGFAHIQLETLEYAAPDNRIEVPEAMRRVRRIFHEVMDNNDEERLRQKIEAIQLTGSERKKYMILTARRSAAREWQ